MVYRFLILVALSLLIGGCGSKGIAPFPTKAFMNIEASGDINPNNNGRPSPVVIRVFGLRSANPFNQLDFFDIYDDAAKALEGSMTNKMEFNLKPNEATYQEQGFPADTTHIGVIAAFRNIDDAKWRDIVEISRNQGNKIKITIENDKIAINPDSKK